MRLVDLKPFFVRYETRQEDGKEREYTHTVDSLGDAQGIFFLCPKCFAADGGEVGTHAIDVTFADRGALPNQGSHGTDGSPTRWTVTGSDFSNLTTAPSILLIRGCAWHGFITNGEVS
jgi:hypothetical protein